MAHAGAPRTETCSRLTVSTAISSSGCFPRHPKCPDGGGFRLPARPLRWPYPAFAAHFWALSRSVFPAVLLSVRVSETGNSVIFRCRLTRIPSEPPAIPKVLAACRTSLSGNFRLRIRESGRLDQGTLVAEQGNPFPCSRSNESCPSQLNGSLVSRIR